MTGKCHLKGEMLEQQPQPALPTTGKYHHGAKVVMVNWYHRTCKRPTMLSRSLSVKDIDHFQKMDQQHKLPSQRVLCLKWESWSDFHEKHHSIDYKNLSKFVFKNGCSCLSLFAHALNHHSSLNKCWHLKAFIHDETPWLIVMGKCCHVGQLQSNCIS